MKNAVIPTGWRIWGYIDKYECIGWKVWDILRQPVPIKRLTSDSSVIPAVYAISNSTTADFLSFLQLGCIYSIAFFDGLTG